MFGRWCTTCQLLNRGNRPATVVVRNAEGLAWYECGHHRPDDEQQHPEGPWVAWVRLDLFQLGMADWTPLKVDSFKTKLRNARKSMERALDTMGVKPDDSRLFPPGRFVPGDAVFAEHMEAIDREMAKVLLGQSHTSAAPSKPSPGFAPGVPVTHVHIAPQLPLPRGVVTVDELRQLAGLPPLSKKSGSHR
jgi:hypothetical protein